MDEVETKLVVETGPKSAGLPFRCFGADHDFAVLEGDYVSCPRFAQETPVDVRDPPVRDEDHLHLGQLREQTGFSTREIEADVESFLCEFAERTHVHAHLPLPVGDADRSAHVSGRVSAWKFRVISRAPLLNVT